MTYETDYKDTKTLEDDQIVTQVVPTSNAPVVHDVWGDLEEGGPNYRGLGWIRASVVLMKIQIGLGVLAIPSVLHTLGFVPGILLIVVIAVVITWSDWIVGTFKLNHPEVYTLADVGFIIWGPVGREILGGAYWLYLTFVAGAGLLGISTAFNAITDHGTCTAVFVLVGAILNIAISSIQTLDKISWLGWVGLIGILSSVITLAIAVSLQDRPSAAPLAPLPWSPGVVTIGNPSFTEGAAACANIIFSFAGTPNFFNVVSEMREPKHYYRAMYTCQTVVTLAYLVIGSLVYKFCGQYVASPALGSAGPLLKKVCYGLALPGLIIGCVLNTHLPAKYIFVRLMRNTRHFTKNTFIHYAVWFGCVSFNCGLSFLVAEAIPIFGDLLSLVGAFLSTPLSLTIEGIMYIYDCRRFQENPFGTIKKKVIHAANMFMIVASVFCMIAGTYAAIVIIKDHVNDGATSKPFSCADNSK